MIKKDIELFYFMYLKKNLIVHSAPILGSNAITILKIFVEVFVEAEFHYTLKEVSHTKVLYRARNILRNLMLKY